jgi:hypothetical protein
MSSNINNSYIANSNESWYEAFVTPTMNRLFNDDLEKMVKLGPLNISKTTRSGYKYFGIADNIDSSEERTTLLIPKFVIRYLLSPRSNVKEMLRNLRRESLMIVVNYQFGFKQLEKFN